MIDAKGLKPCLKVVVHYIPGIPVQGDVIKHNKLVAMAAIRDGFSETNRESGEKDH